jgi:hypothetical protein
MAEQREGEAPAEPEASFSSASAGGMHYGPPADADLLVGLGSAAASPSRKSLTALPVGASPTEICSPQKIRDDQQI